MILRKGIPEVQPLFSARTWVEIGLALFMLLSLIFFSQAVFAPQVAFSSDRVALMSLRELWVQSAAGFGLRSGVYTREDFLTEYSHFRARPSVRKLLQTDTTFSRLAGKADTAFAQLETSELRGDAGAARQAAAFDEALGSMEDRVADYAKSQVDAFRSFFVVIILGLVATIVSVVVLELRLRASSVGEARNRALSRALIAAQESERLRISRELHDAVAQDLAAAKLYCDIAGTPDANTAGKLLDRAINEVRNICYGLRPAELDRLGIAEAGARLCSETARDSGMEVNFSAEGLACLDLEAEIEITLYRILQEALSNVRRHAGGKHVRVRIFGFGNYVELTVEDDGRGPGGTEPGLGRTGMEERARMMGGSFHFGFGPWGGSSLRVTMPTCRKEGPS